MEEKITSEKIEELAMEMMLSESHTPSGKISVSSLIYPCLRKAYYTKTIGSFFDKNTAITFWVGKQIHNSRLLSDNELEVEHEGILGIVDDYDKKTGILIDKKTCDMFPGKYGVNDHYKKQLEYYYWLLTQNKYPVKQLYLLFIKVSKPKGIKAVEILPRTLHTINKEILEKKEVLEKALKEKIPPPRKPSWLCGYCGFANICYKKEYNSDIETLAEEAERIKGKQAREDKFKRSGK